MAQVVEIKKVTVGPRYLDAVVEVGESAPLMTSDDAEGTARIMDLARDMDLDYHPARHAARLWHEAQNATMARKPRPRT